MVEGDVGIGTPNPVAKLEVSREMRLAPMSQAPASPQPGMIYFDASDATMYYYRSAALGWAPLSGGGGGAFGPLQNKSFATVYQASTDGFVMTVVAGMIYCYGETENVSPPNYVVATAVGGGSTTGSIMFPVRKNEYWRVRYRSTLLPSQSMVWWMPVGE